MRALITGGTGFVGAHLQAHLQSCGDSVTALGSHDANITDFDALLKKFNEAKPQVVYHLAGLAFVPECETNFARAIEINVAGADNVLRAARAVCPDAVVLLVSTGDAYGAVPVEELPSSESHPLRPMNNYGLSKVFLEQVGSHAQRIHRQRVVIARPFNHVGPGQVARFAVASFAQQLATMKREDKLAPIKVGNLSAKRDLSDVRDIVRGYRLAAIHGQGLFNFCSGKSVSIQWVLDTLIEISGLKVEVVIDPEKIRKIDNPESRGTYERAEKQLGWKPQIELKQTLQDCFEFYLRN